MGAGAAKSSVTIQYCMAYGRHTVASAEIAAVNQIRASDDYATGVKLGDHGQHRGHLRLCCCCLRCCLLCHYRACDASCRAIAVRSAPHTEVAVSITSL